MEFNCVYLEDVNCKGTVVRKLMNKSFKLELYILRSHPRHINKCDGPFELKISIFVPVIRYLKIVFIVNIVFHPKLKAGVC